jgi:hypothetical protein
MGEPGAAPDKIADRLGRHSNSDPATEAAVAAEEEYLVVVANVGECNRRDCQAAG